MHGQDVHESFHMGLPFCGCGSRVLAVAAVSSSFTYRDRVGFVQEAVPGYGSISFSIRYLECNMLYISYYV